MKSWLRDTLADTGGGENRGETSKFARVSHLLHGAKAAAEPADTRWRRDAAGGDEK